MMDIAKQLGAIQREVRSGEETTVLLCRRYDAPVEDVWDAVTDPDRMRRWFLPISGDLRVGGTFQLEGNAGGEILRCEPPRLLRVTFGGETSLVELRLSPEGDDGTVLELEHTVPSDMAGGAAGALFVGPGWDGALLGLGMFLAGEVVDDPVAAANSPESQEYSKGSAYAWAAVIESSGLATTDEVAEALRVSVKHFAPDLDPDLD